MDESSFTIPADDNGDTELDPRIQVELEKLNAATDEINKLELALDDSMKTFHSLLNETSRRLHALAKRLGSCVEKSRPYYEAVAAAAAARNECQKAAVQYQRASEVHAAAKETVTLAEQRFVSKQDELQFDNNWQEALNHATIKVMDAEKKKTESGRMHQRKAVAYISAQKRASRLEENLKRNILKSRPYFEEKKLCDEQMQMQNAKIEKLQDLINNAKVRYSNSLKALEEISEEIHKRRGEFPPENLPVGPREPGVGAERDPVYDETAITRNNEETKDETTLQELRLRVRVLALKPIDQEDIETDESWAVELNETINKLDHLLMMKESNQLERSKFTATSPKNASAPTTSAKTTLKYGQPPSDSWQTSSKLVRTKSRSREAVYEHPPLPISKSEKSKSMMSLDVLALARDTTIFDRESYLKAVIEDKSPSGTYTESNSDRNDSPDEILMVECDSSDSTQTPVIKMTNSTVTDSDNS